MQLKPGDKLGPYEIVSAIGKGGMGEVWKARDPRLNRDVAIKTSARQFTDRFEREAQVVASLNHANICTLYDVGPDYLVMELIEGPTLAERIAEGPIPLEEALAIAKQIAAALETAHEKPIVHRDLKPANVKIKADGQVKVLDFGLAKSGGFAEVTSDSPTLLTVAGMILGTAGYTPNADGLSTSATGSGFNATRSSLRCIFSMSPTRKQMLASPSPQTLITPRMRSAVGEWPAGAISSSVILSRVNSTVSAPSLAPRQDGAHPSSN